MVRHLVELKLRLLRGGLRAGGARSVIGFAVAWVFAISAGAVGGLLLHALHRVDDDVLAADLLAMAFALVLVLWMMGPLTVGSEGTLEADRLALLPLRAGQVMPGLLAAGGVGFGGLASVLLLAGAVAGTAPASPMAVFSVAGAALALGTFVACSRLTSTALAAAMQTRRLRDLALVVGPLAGLAFSVAGHVLGQAVEDERVAGDTVELPDVVRVLVRIAPSGPPAMVMAAARDGDVVVATAALAGGVALVAVLLRLWWAAIDRVLTTARDHNPAGGRRRRGLLAGGRSVLPATRFGAVLAKEVRLAWRDPRQRATYLGSVVPAIAPLISFGVFSPESRGGWLLVLAAIPAFVLGAAGTNLFGFDGPAHWTNVAAAGRSAVRDDLAAKGAARVVLMVPFVAVAAIVLALLTGAWAWVPLAVALAVAAAGVTIGAGFLASVTAPMALPDTPTNPFSTGNAGQGMAAVGTGCGTMIFSSAVLGPPAIAAVLLGDTPLYALGLIVLSLALGAGFWRLGLRLAVARASGREPELLAALSSSRGT